MIKYTMNPKATNKITKQSVIANNPMKEITGIQNKQTNKQEKDNKNQMRQIDKKYKNDRFKSNHVNNLIKCKMV